MTLDEIKTLFTNLHLKASPKIPHVKIRFTQAVRFFFKFTARNAFKAFINPVVLFIGLLQAIIISSAIFAGLYSIEILTEFDSSHEVDHPNAPDPLVLIILAVIYGITVLLSIPLSLTRSWMRFIFLKQNQPESQETEHAPNGFKRMMENFKALWMFKFLSLWKKVSYFLMRISKDNDDTARERKEQKEHYQLYLRWKIGSLAIIPNLLLGKSPKEAAKESIEFANKKYIRLLLYQKSHTLFCWTCGSIIFFTSLFNEHRYRDLFIEKYSIKVLDPNTDYYLLYSSTIHFSVTLLILMLIFNPLYMFGISTEYADYRREKTKEVTVRRNE